MNHITDTVTLPLYLRKIDGMTSDERRAYTNEELLRKVNPCGWQMLQKYRDEPDPGSCTDFLSQVRGCRSDDFRCAEFVLGRVLKALECNAIRMSRLATGAPAPRIEAHVVLAVPLAMNKFAKSLKILVDVEHLLTMEQKTHFFQVFQQCTNFSLSNTTLSIPTL